MTPRNTEYDPDVRVMIDIYGGVGLEMTSLDREAREALQLIRQLYQQIRAMDDADEIAIAHQRIADLKQDRVEYVEHCQLHARPRRS